MRYAIGDTSTSMQGSNREVFLTSEVHELLNKIRDILYRAFSK